MSEIAGHGVIYETETMHTHWQSTMLAYFRKKCEVPSFIDILNPCIFVQEVPLVMHMLHSYKLMSSLRND